MEEILKPLFRTWKKLIILLGLGVLAYYTSVKFVLSAVIGEFNTVSLYGIIILSLIFFTSSLIAFKFFPKKFSNWDFSWKKSLKSKKLSDKLAYIAILIVFVSPLTNLVMSLGLTVFTFSFIKSDVNIFWEKTIIDSETIYTYLGAVAFHPFIILLGILLGVGMLIKKIFRKLDPLKYTVPILFFISLMALGFSKDSPLIQEVGDVILIISSKIVQFVIGALPLGWFYELFIDSITKEGKESI